MSSIQQDCLNLYKAFKGLGCDDRKVVDILAHRNYVQRQELRREYKIRYGNDLIDKLKSELHAKLEKAVVLWMLEPVERDAAILRDALQGLGTKDTALIDIVCTRNTSQIEAIQRAYTSMYKRNLYADIASDTSGDYRTLLMAYITNPRRESPFDADESSQALEDAKLLYKATEGMIGTDEADIIQVFSSRTARQLNAAFRRYWEIYNEDFQKVVESETSGKFSKLLKTIIQCVINPTKYFAEMLYWSMKGIGTNDDTLIRVIVTRAEIDLHTIKMEFQRLYNENLEDMISSDTSGNYQRFLLAIVRAGHH